MGGVGISRCRHQVHHLWQPPCGQQGVWQGLPCPGWHLPAPRPWLRPHPLPTPFPHVSSCPSPSPPPLSPGPLAPVPALAPAPRHALAIVDDQTTSYLWLCLGHLSIEYRQPTTSYGTPYQISRDRQCVWQILERHMPCSVSCSRRPCRLRLHCQLNNPHAFAQAAFRHYIHRGGNA